MASFARRGHLFTSDLLMGGDLIEIARMEDGKLFIHNGHHRCVAIAGTRKRDYLDENEYYVKEQTYSLYNSINFDVGYVTPHDIKTEIRVPDLKNYKTFMQNVIDEYGYEMAEGIIAISKPLYANPRKLYDVYDLADNEYASYMGDF